MPPSDLVTSQAFRLRWGMRFVVFALASPENVPFVWLLVSGLLSFSLFVFVLPRLVDWLMGHVIWPTKRGHTRVALLFHPEGLLQGCFSCVTSCWLPLLLLQLRRCGFLETLLGRSGLTGHWTRLAVFFAHVMLNCIGNKPFLVFVCLRRVWNVALANAALVLSSKNWKNIQEGAALKCRFSESTIGFLSCTHHRNFKNWTKASKH